jgi:hypothetical protein
MSTTSDAIALKQARSTRRKYRRSLTALNERHAALSAMGKPALTKALAEVSKAKFQDKAQAIKVILSNEFGADVYARYDAKVLNPVVKEEATPSGKSNSKAPAKRGRKAAAAAEEVAEVAEFDEDDADELEEDETDE